MHCVDWLLVGTVRLFLDSGNSTFKGLTLFTLYYMRARLEPTRDNPAVPLEGAHRWLAGCVGAWCPGWWGGWGVGWAKRKRWL